MHKKSNTSIHLTKQELISSTSPPRNTPCIGKLQRLKPPQAPFSRRHANGRQLFQLEVGADINIDGNVNVHFTGYLPRARHEG